MKTKNVNKGSRGFAVTEEKYEPIRKAILASMPRNAKGITFKELVAQVATRVPKELFPKSGSVSWYTKVVQLDSVVLAAGLTTSIAILFTVSFLTKLTAVYLGALVAGRSNRRDAPSGSGGM